MTSDDDLTSSAAVERQVTIKGYVYVEAHASQSSMVSAVQRQVRTAFGPLRIGKISVDDRELKRNVDPATFSSELVKVMRKTGSGGDTGTDLTEGGVNAQGVLKLVNDTNNTAATLVDEVGLSLEKAQAIVQGRPFGTIAALSTVPQVEASTLQTMLAYAKSHGYVEGVGDQYTVVKEVKRVSYTYRARGLVVKNLAQKPSFSFAMLMGNYQSFVDEIIKSCVENYEHDREFASSFWYIWSPNESSCKTLISKETEEVLKESQGLAPDQIAEKEYGRRFLPIAAQLDPTTAPRTTFPELDRLLALDDPSKDRVVIYQIVGQASHDGDPAAERFENDMKFAEAVKEIKILADQWKHLRVASDSPVNPLSISFQGKTYSATFKDLYQWVVNKSSFPSEISYQDRDAFRRAIHDIIFLKWLKLEAPLKIVDGRNSKNMTLEVRMLYGTDSSWSVRNYFREAFKNGDVVMYMGHSYIGSGPQDPNNYTPNDFPEKYQILFFQSCVSFNYYGVDYFNHKLGGTKNMDLVTNGLESYVRDGGKSMGQFIVALFNKKPLTWLNILEKTRVNTWWGLHDPNRNVDGEQDNTYDPNQRPIEIMEAPTTGELEVQLTSSACNSTVSKLVELSAASASASRVEFLVQQELIGSDESTPFSLSWDSTTMPNGEVVITARAFDSQGNTAEASCTMRVENSTGNDLFFDDMEGGQGQWSQSGLWHLAENSSCANPGAASGRGAWYFGQSQECNYATGSAASGTLTTGIIVGLSASSTLSFKYYREVEASSSGGFDQTKVEIAEAGGDDWQVVWSQDSKTSSEKKWLDVAPLSLGSYAGKSIQVRFSFNSVDSYLNEYTGWLIDDVRVTR